MQNLGEVSHEELTVFLNEALDNGSKEEKIPRIAVPPVCFCATYNLAEKDDETAVRARLQAALGGLVRTIPYSTESAGLRKIHLKFVTRSDYDAAKLRGKEMRPPHLLRACTHGSCTDHRAPDFIAWSSTLTFTDISKSAGFASAFGKVLEAKLVLCDSIYVNKTQRVMLNLYDYVSAVNLQKASITFCGKKLDFNFGGSRLNPCPVCGSLEHRKAVCPKLHLTLRLRFSAPVSYEYVDALAKVGAAAVRPFGDATANHRVYDVVFETAAALQSNARTVILAGRDWLQGFLLGPAFEEGSVCNYCAAKEHRGLCPRATADRARTTPIFPLPVEEPPVAAAALAAAVAPVAAAVLPPVVQAEVAAAIAPVGAAVCAAPAAPDHPVPPPIPSIAPLRAADPPDEKVFELGAISEEEFPRLRSPHGPPHRYSAEMAHARSRGTPTAAPAQRPPPSPPTPPQTRAQQKKTAQPQPKRGGHQ